MKIWSEKKTHTHKHTCRHIHQINYCNSMQFPNTWKVYADEERLTVGDGADTHMK